MREIFEGGKHCRSGPFVRRYFNLWLRTPEKALFYDMHLFFLTTRYLNPRSPPPRLPFYKLPCNRVREPFGLNQLKSFTTSTGFFGI
jgi:hypothetical protein